MPEIRDSCRVLVLYRPFTIDRSCDCTMCSIVRSYLWRPVEEVSLYTCYCRVAQKIAAGGCTRTLSTQPLFSVKGVLPRIRSQNFESEHVNVYPRASDPTIDPPTLCKLANAL